MLIQSTQKKNYRITNKMKLYQSKTVTYTTGISKNKFYECLKIVIWSDEFTY